MLFNVTINDISVIYVTAHRCAGGLKKKLDLRSGSQRHRHFVGFFNVPVLAPTRDHPFYTVIPTHRPHLVAFYDHAGDTENLHGIIKQMKKRKEGVCMKTDKDANFLTGIKTISLFSKIHDIVAPLVTRRWTGVSSMIRGLKKYKKKPLKLGPTRKLSSKSEFLLALMKLRLGLLKTWRIDLTFLKPSVPEYSFHG